MKKQHKPLMPDQSATLKEAVNFLTEENVKAYKLIERLNRKCDYLLKIVTENKSDMLQKTGIIITILLRLLSPGILHAQDDLYMSSDRKQVKSGVVTFKTDTEKIQFCLGQYYKQRQTGLIYSISGSAVIVGSAIAFQNNKQVMKAGMVIGGILDLTGFVVTIDAEKWLNKASISITPTSVKINF
jgi:hypothetical protein